MTRFVTFAIQKPLDTQVMMLAVWSHTNAIQLVKCKFKVSWVKFVLNSSDTNLFSAEKKCLNMLKTCSMGVLHGIFYLLQLIL